MGETSIWTSKPRERVWAIEDYYTQNVWLAVGLLVCVALFYFDGFNIFEWMWGFGPISLLFLLMFGFPLVILPIWLLVWPVRIQLCRRFLNYYLTRTYAIAEYRFGWVRFCWVVKKAFVRDFWILRTKSFCRIEFPDLYLEHSMTTWLHFNFMFDGLTIDEVKQVVTDFGSNNRFVWIWSDREHECIDWVTFWHTGGIEFHWINHDKATYS